MNPSEHRADDEPPHAATSGLSPFMEALHRSAPEHLIAAAAELQEAREAFVNAQETWTVFGDTRAVRETKNAIAAAERALQKLEILRDETFVDESALQQEIALAGKAVADARADDVLRAKRAEERANGIVTRRKALADAVWKHREALEAWLKPALQAADEQAAAAYASLIEAQAFALRARLPYDTGPFRIARRIVGAGEYEGRSPKMPAWLQDATQEWQHGYRALAAK